MNRTRDNGRRWYSWASGNSIWATAFASSFLCWLAFPPVGWGWLAWIAPIGWLSLVGREQLAGKHPYRAIWLAGLVFWMLTLHWIRLPHPMNYLGWPVLAGYLGCYLPLFVALSRMGVHRLRLPLWLVAPVVWTGLDWVRGNFMTGFLMGSLAHTQAQYPPMIQIASLLGEYGVTFLILFVASCLTQRFSSGYLQRVPFYCNPLTIAVVAVLAVLGHGTHLVLAPVSSEFVTEGATRIAIIQGNTPVDWKAAPDRQTKIMQQHAQLTRDAIDQSQQRDNRGVDLVIWPETMYRNPWLTIADGYVPPAERLAPSDREATKRDLQEFARQAESAIFTGIDRYYVYPDEAGEPDFQGYNSSVMINKQGELVGTYDKMHLVIMGEYVPFADWIPALKRLTPMTGFANPGTSPSALESDGIVYCPNICYETCVPHLIRRQVKQLAAAGTPAQVLVNLTNDAWFRGSSELDMHLACGVFRAVEMRMPLLIAANGGLSAYVDPCGIVRQVTPRQQTATLLVDLPQLPPGELSFYAKWGDWFAGLCVICCMALAIFGWRSPEPSDPASRDDAAS